MPNRLPLFKPIQKLGDDIGEGLHRGHRPVIFDVVSADRQTSLLPEGFKMVMHVNPRSMSLSYGKQIERTQTRGGFVEFHWGDAAEEVTFEAATGGFMRLWSGLSNITGGSGKQGRRETIAYDKYLDLLALFHNNGAIYDARGNIVSQGYIKMSFDGGVHIGWFDSSFSVTESAQTPFMFNLNTKFIIDEEILRWHSSPLGLRDDSFDPDLAATSTYAPSVVQGTLDPEGAAAQATSLLDPEIDFVRDSSVDPFLEVEELLNSQGLGTLGAVGR